MNIIVMDGQGGGVGRALVEALKRELPGQRLLAVGTNALATAAMLRAGADAGASGENAVKVNAREADVILGPIGIVMADALMGEMSPAMAHAVSASGARKILISTGRCHVQVAGASDTTLSIQIEDAVRLLRRIMQAKDENN